MSLHVHVLNVGHGDSIILEYKRNDERVYGLIDSNSNAPTEPPALTRLKELGATGLSFVCLTHPHRDHYCGMYQILREYKGRINEFYTFPLARLSEKYVKGLV